MANERDNTNFPTSFAESYNQQKLAAAEFSRANFEMERAKQELNLATKAWAADPNRDTFRRCDITLDAFKLAARNLTKTNVDLAYGPKQSRENSAEKPETGEKNE